MRMWNNHIGKRYVINNPEGKVLQHQDLVIVYPSKTHGLVFQNEFYAYIYHDGTEWNRTYVVPLEYVDGKAVGQIRLDGSNSELDFNYLQPLLWWSEKDRSIQSPIFKSLASFRGFNMGRFSELPGYTEHLHEDKPNVEIPF